MPVDRWSSSTRRAARPADMPSRSDRLLACAATTASLLISNNLRLEGCNLGRGATECHAALEAMSSRQSGRSQPQFEVARDNEQPSPQTLSGNTGAKTLTTQSGPSASLQFYRSVKTDVADFHAQPVGNRPIEERVIPRTDGKRFTPNHSRSLTDDLIALKSEVDAKLADVCEALCARHTPSASDCPQQMTAEAAINATEPLWKLVAEHSRKFGGGEPDIARQYKEMARECHRRLCETYESTSPNDRLAFNGRQSIFLELCLASCTSDFVEVNYNFEINPEENWASNKLRLQSELIYLAEQYQLNGSLDVARSLVARLHAIVMDQYNAFEKQYPTWTNFLKPSFGRLLTRIKLEVCSRAYKFGNDGYGGLLREIDDQRKPEIERLEAESRYNKGGSKQTRQNQFDSIQTLKRPSNAELASPCLSAEMARQRLKHRRRALTALRDNTAVSRQTSSLSVPSCFSNSPQQGHSKGSRPACGGRPQELPHAPLNYAEC